MEYTINDCVKYNSLDGTLYSLDHNPDVIVLARISNVLLLLLIEHNHKLLSREFLLNEIWEKQGLNSSSNNLNNYISMLRKALTQCGCIGVISTVPKHGFLFDADVVASAPGAVDKSVPSSFTGTAAEGPGGVILSISPAYRKGTSERIKLITFILLGAVICFIPRLNDSYRLHALRNEVSRAGNCRFFVADDDTRTIGARIITERAHSIAQREHINCELETNVYYFSALEHDARGQHMMNELLSYCPNGNKAACHNYWTVK